MQLREFIVIRVPEKAERFGIKRGMYAREVELASTPAAIREGLTAVEISSARYAFWWSLADLLQISL